VLPSLAQAAATARSRLPAEVWDYFDSGAGDETARAEASSAWARHRVRPRVLRPVGQVDLSTTVLGRRVGTPLLGAPAALHGLAAPEAEAATARGLADAGSLLILSARSSLPPEKAVVGPWWSQLYVLRDRGLTRALIDRAVAAGAEAVVLTVDTPFVGRKHRGMADIRRGDLLASLQPLLDALGDDSVGPEAIEQDPDLTPDVIDLVRAASGLPVVVKGVLRGDDAAAVVEAGAAAVYVSNHGGRQLDRAISTARALPEVVDAVAGRAEVYVDGGIRSGTDALIALALGARAVLVARPLLWGLAAAGADGVRRVVGDLSEDLRHALALAGSARPADLTRDLIVPPTS
jgi:4-hydroxymandelate oxidase